MKPRDLHILLPHVIEIAMQAGVATLDFYGGSAEKLNVTKKQDSTLLTQADLTAHAVIDADLKALSLFPVLSEEGELFDDKTRFSWPTYWLVDPLDGTRGFVERRGEFTVNIALIHQHQPVLGVIYAPQLDALYYAIKGDKAYHRYAKAQPLVLSTRAIDWENYKILLGHYQHARPLVELVHQLDGAELEHINSSLKFCVIAQGEADCYPRLGKTSEWDTAAAQCILQSAGGRVVDFSGQPLQYNAKSSLINPPFLAVGDVSAIPPLLDLIKNIRS